MSQCSWNLPDLDHYYIQTTGKTHTMMWIFVSRYLRRLLPGGLLNLFTNPVSSPSHSSLQIKVSLLCFVQLWPSKIHECIWLMLQKNDFKVLWDKTSELLVLFVIKFHNFTPPSSSFWNTNPHSLHAVDFLFLAICSSTQLTASPLPITFSVFSTGFLLQCWHPWWHLFHFQWNQVLND